MKEILKLKKENDELRKEVAFLKKAAVLLHNNKVNFLVISVTKMPDHNNFIQKHSAIDELTAPLLNELIEKIIVQQSRKDGNGKTVRDIGIYYHFVGEID